MYSASMLLQILRSLTVAALLLAMTVAGLPLIVCVSNAHGAAIEIDQPHAISRHGETGRHFLLFKSSSSLNSLDGCRDFSLQRATLGTQKCDHAFEAPGWNDSPKSPKGCFITAGIWLVSTPASMRTSLSDGVRPLIRSYLTDRSTIVLRI